MSLKELILISACLIILLFLVGLLNWKVTFLEARFEILKIRVATLEGAK